MEQRTSLSTHPLAGNGTSAGGPTPEGRPARLSTVVERAGPVGIDWRQAVGGALVGLGLVAVALAWFGVARTIDPGEQMPYLVSGGIGGAALVAVGLTLVVMYEHARDRAALWEVLGRLEEVETSVEELREETRALVGTRSTRGRAAKRSGDEVGS